MEGYTLYRFYDERNTLLYIGKSVNVAHRIKDHIAGKPWWDTVTRIELERFSSAGALARAEQHAIEIEHPLHNIIYQRTLPLGMSMELFEMHCPECRNRWRLPPTRWWIEHSDYFDCEILSAEFRCDIMSYHKWFHVFALDDETLRHLPAVFESAP